MPPQRAAASPARAKSPARPRATSRAKKTTTAEDAAPSLAVTEDAKELKENKLTAAAAAKFSYEFGGPIGALGITISLPLVIYMLYFGCASPKSCVSSVPDAIRLPTLLMDGLSDGLSNISDVKLWSWEVTAIVFGWTALHFVLCELATTTRKATNTR